MDAELRAELRAVQAPGYLHTLLPADPADEAPRVGLDRALFARDLRGARGDRRGVRLAMRSRCEGSRSRHV